MGKIPWGGDIPKYHRLQGIFFPKRKKLKNWKILIFERK
jgi:hypothetical protein